MQIIIIIYNIIYGNCGCFVVFVVAVVETAWKMEQQQHLRPDSSELVDLDAFLWHVLELQRLEPLGGAVVVVALHDRLGLLETDVVEAGERGPVDVPYRVVRYEKVLLPAHKHVVAIR